MVEAERENAPLTPQAPTAAAAARPNRRLLLVLFAVAVVVRALYFWQYLHSPLFGQYVVDHAYYRDWALRIAAGDWRGEGVFDKGPLYPYLLGIVYRLLGPHDGWVLAGQLLLGATVPVWLFLVGKRLSGERVAMAAGLCTAVYGPLVYYECMIMKTFLLPLLLLIMLAAGLRYGADRRAGWLVLAGLALGLMGLVQENHLLLWLPVAAWVWSAGRAAVRPGRARLVGLTVLALATALPIVPCAIRNYAVTGEYVFVTAGGGEVFYMAHGPDAEAVYSPPPFVTADAAQEHRDFLAEAERRLGRPLTRQESSRYWFGEAWRYATAHPGREIALAISKGLVLFQDFEVPDSESFSETRRVLPVLYFLPTFGWFVALGFVGVGHAALRSPRPMLLPLGTAAVLGLSVVLTYNFGRFRIALAPLWVLFAAQGVAWLGSVWRRRTAPNGALALTGSIFFVAVVTGLTFLAGSGSDYRLSQAIRDGVTAAQAGDLARAEERFRAALELGPGSGDEPAIHNNLGAVLARQGRLEEAFRHFAEAVRLNPEYQDARQNLFRVQADLQAARQRR